MSEQQNCSEALASHCSAQSGKTDLVVALEEVVEVVPLTDRVASSIHCMAAALLEVVLPLCHQAAHALHMITVAVFITD